ncbi:Solute-binding protein family 5 domain-containing protein [Bordetella sputigena]|uniref:ABC transporter substrate-binding protein n=1 Tax=Bordetella sputigena TaxID=1416810 RepID=UPI0039EE33BD
MKHLFRCWMAAFLIAFALPAAADDLRIGTRTPDPALDPHFMWTDANVGYYVQIYGGLTAQANDGKVLPYLAESWSTPDGGKTWRFKLRHDVKFSDGTPVTADDVVASYKRMQTIKASAPFTGAIAGLQEARKVDDHTVDIVTSKSNPILPQRVSLIQIIPARIAASATTADFSDGKAAVGFGPYKFVSFKAGDSLVLERNPGFFGPPAKWDKVTYRFIPDGGARVAALLGKDVDMIDAVPPALAARLKADPTVSVIMGPSSRLLFLTIDTNRPQTPYAFDAQGKPLPKNPYADPRVRQALSLAVDRKALVDRVLGGMAYPASQITTKGFGGFDDTLALAAPDVAKAKQLLAQAGYPQGFAMTIHCTNDRFIEDARVCQAIGQMFSRIGLKVDVQTMPYAVLTPRAMDPNGERFSIAMMGWADSSGEALVLNNVVHTPDTKNGFGSWNWGRYSNPQVDRLIEQAANEMDTPRRHDLMKQAMRVAMDDYGFIPLYAQSVVVGVRKGLTYQTWVTEQTIADSVSKAQP